jgi:hypothetical protein
MNLQVHLDWQGEPHLVGRLFTAEKSVTFEYAPEWINRPGAFAIDPTSLPLRVGPQHSSTLFGALGDCGPDRWGRVLIERAVRKGILVRKPYHDIDYVPEIDRAKVPQTAIAENLDEPSIAGALAAAPRFGLDAREAKSVLREVVRAVAKWREIGRQLRLKAPTLNAYATAFEHTLSDEAARLVG